ncbi:18338_t:CDS:1, partial [Entrophospora sp. SA101]
AVGLNNLFELVLNLTIKSPDFETFQLSIPNSVTCIMWNNLLGVPSSGTTLIFISVAYPHCECNFIERH